MKIPKRHEDDLEEHDKNYDEMKGWYDPMQDKYIEPRYVDAVILDLISNERWYVMGHSMFAGYEVGAPMGALMGAAYWILINRNPPVVRHFLEPRTAPSSSSLFYSTPPRRSPEPHITTFRKPWHILVQRMGTGSIIGTFVGMTFGLLSIRFQPNVCPFRRVLYQEQQLPLPSPAIMPKYEQMSDYPQQLHYVHLLQRNFHARMTESGAVVGLLITMFALSVGDGPMWFGLARGYFGIAQFMGLGSSAGIGLSLIASWYVDDMMERWQEKVKQKRLEEGQQQQQESDEAT